MRIALLILSLIVTLPARAADVAESRGGMVVCVSPLAADVGAAVLKKGGTAVDAAVAVALAQAVTWPEAGNIGGGGFMLVHPGPGKDPVAFDYREVAPAAADKNTLAKVNDFQSILTAGVPGTVRGLAMAHKKFGKLPWKDLVMPAVKFAEEGFTVNAALARSLNSATDPSKTKNAEFLRVYGKNGGKDRWVAGDSLKLPDLGRTLRAIAEDGPNAFYTGKAAEQLAAEMKASGGLISLDDLKKYEAVERKPLRGTYRGYEVIGLPPPSSGGTTLIEMLNILEQFDLKKHPWSSPETTHLVAEAMRRAYADRAKFIGDPAFTQAPEELISKAYAKKLAATIDLKKATPSEDFGPPITEKAESNETTHFSIVDKAGMAVSNTYTLENSFGCKIVVRGAGYILNNEMTDFNTQPGVTNKLGRIGTDANLIAPGKRMLSSQSPTLVLKDGKVYLVTGSPGGRTIINTVLTVVVNVVDYGASIGEAVDAPRMHHQWFPNQIGLEDRPGFDPLVSALKDKGHTAIKRRQGDAHSILIDPKSGNRIGAADRRLDGKAAGE